MSGNIKIAALGLPRIGARRELKFALEGFWSGKLTEAELLAKAAELRAENWRRLQRLGVDVIPSNDFSLYDHVLDMAVTVGAVPERFEQVKAGGVLATYFAMARGSTGTERDACEHSHGDGVAALEMTKWFDTNYHYMVPELHAGQAFALAGEKPVAEYLEARALGIETRPVLLGPVSFLKLSKCVDGSDPLALLPRLLPLYVELLARLREAGAEWVQIDEPCLVLDLQEREREAYAFAFGALATKDAPKIMLATYFGGLGENLAVVSTLPVHGLHVDLVRAPDQLDAVLDAIRPESVLSLGVIDGRNVWRADLARLIERLEPVVRGRQGVVQIAPSCSLIHVPIDLELETELDVDLKTWLAFALQKIEELGVLKAALSGEAARVGERIEAATHALEARRRSAKVHSQAVAARLAQVRAGLTRRSLDFQSRRKLQNAALGLPSFPTTTIGSFPQTPEVRKARAAHRRGEIQTADYLSYLRRETEAAIRWQEEVGLDVLVHGEFERNDMVQYFGEQLSGYAFTSHGWVQSYGSRYVRPPVIFGDVSRPEPMTVDWAKFAQSLTDKPVKGMLTGPVTMLQWSFPRDDVPRETTCRQIALALRDEVQDLEAAGISIIQVDEPALREGLPLKQGEWHDYLEWAVDCFRLATCGVAAETQIHTHMCYAEFNDIIEAIEALDADVISIETSRSRMELLDAFSSHAYGKDIGPGVFDIHSPRVPPAEEMSELLQKAKDGLKPWQIWVNPDCGLKTRAWEEVRPALANMVEAARRLRSSV
ncbi:5-methyltetrahydropteroyltriglutamate--homocysteine S-methyltransferase [Nitratireductor basaltis]|uniref:5-methyltetrahydropteroyltriglutamate--homocysteine methyltransferase n=1 Tax=Nitratireductor basaltis TaxID=472175 RepID=A0A084U8C7_9HYPH|nr:5-methyltetrahydropteroyltriglutamate--homocysteine S-methyltransferase [Nitratireductor basaltis]KFB09213.1 5-methyltetrahydropteroyltriglutamate--homocysteine methyltransferase [Nitratireductor basaltis]